MRIKTLACAFVLVAHSIIQAHALGFAPMAMELTAAGSGARTQFSVSNDSTAPAAVEITIETLSYTEDGKRITAKGGDDVLITPTTAAIPPGATQTFRVQWVGAPDLAKSQSFLVSANQLPIRDTSGKSRIQVVQGFGAILNVGPANGVAGLKLISAVAAKTPKGEPALSILVENPTNTHALISNSALRAGNQIVTPGAMRTRVGIGVVEPGKRRRFLVPLEQPAAASGATLEYRPNR